MSRTSRRSPARVLRALLVLALVLLAAPAGGSQRSGDVEVGLDLHRAVDTRLMAAEDPCGGRFTPSDDGTGFLYEEEDPSGEDGLAGGYGSSGCGLARIGIVLPEGVSSLRASFFADRRIETFPASAPGESAQGVIIRDLDPPRRIVHQSEYFSPEEGAQADRSHEVRFDVPPALRNATLEFYFEDRPPLDGAAPASSPLSGRDFKAYVHDIGLLVHGAPVGDARVVREDQREGTLLLDEVRVRLQVPEATGGFLPVPRVRVPPEFDFASLRLPDGRVVTAQRSWNGSLAGDAVLVERDASGLRVRVPPDLVAGSGPGEYELVLQATQDVRVGPALLPLAVLLLAVPLPFAVLALVQARVFRREAFGAYRRAALYLMVGVVGMVAYYLFVVLSAFVAGRLDLMGVWPLPLEGWLLYAQVAAAGAAFVVLWLSARALYWITRPRPGARGGGGRPEAGAGAEGGGRRAPEPEGPDTT